MHIFLFTLLSLRLSAKVSLYHIFLSVVPSEAKLLCSWQVWSLLLHVGFPLNVLVCAWSIS